MGYNQREYLEFYDRIRKRLNEIVYKETGVYEFYIPHEPANMHVGEAVITDPDKVSFKSSSKDCRENSGPTIKKTFASTPESISLSEELYGNFIDKEYKDSYILLRELENSNYTWRIRSLVEKIAMDIYETFKKK